jgi:threonine dehydrogenase-like Zn-dependent dehydrogenase
MMIPFMHYILKEITTKCVLAYDDNDFKETVDAFVAGQYATFLFSQLTDFAGKFDGLETMITSRIRLDQITNQGFDQLLQHKDNHIKIMVTPNELNV